MPDHTGRLFRISDETMAVYQRNFGDGWTRHAAVDCAGKVLGNPLGPGVAVHVTEGSHVDLSEGTGRSIHSVVAVHREGSLFEVWGYLPAHEAKTLAKQFNGSIGLAFFRPIGPTTKAQSPATREETNG